MRLYSSVRSSASGLSSVPSSCPSLATSLSLSNTVGSFHETHHRSTGFIPACLPFLSTVQAPFLFLSPRLCSLSSARLPLPLNSSSILIPLSPFLVRIIDSFFLRPAYSFSRTRNLLPNGVPYGGPRQVSLKTTQESAKGTTVAPPFWSWSFSVA